jgi:hypothetical protein
MFERGLWRLWCRYIPHLPFKGGCKLNSMSLMQWKCYQTVLHGKTCAGKDNFVLCLQYKESTTKAFLDYLWPEFKKFIYHNYVYHFQNEQYHTCMQSFPKDSILCAIDFAENCIFQDYHEIQEMH